MKTNKLLLIILILFIVTCSKDKDKEPKYEVYANHDISVCGTTDPSINLQWLNEFIENNKASTYSIIIYAYANSETNDENIVIDVIPHVDENFNVAPNPYFWKKAYSCSGVQLFKTQSGGIDSNSWNNFFNSGQNTIKGIIWYRKIVY